MGTITVSNDTSAPSVSYQIWGVVSGADSVEVASGVLSDGGEKSVTVSGFKSYDVYFDPIGNVVSSGTPAYAVARVAENTTIQLGLTVNSDVG